MTSVFSVDARFMLSGLLVGLLVGQTGVGGGSLMTPLLVLVFGIHPAAAVGTDLLYASATKMAGSLVHGFNRNVDWRLTGRLAMGSLPATAITLFVVSKFDLFGPNSAKILSVALGVVLVVTAVGLFLRNRLLPWVGGMVEQVGARRTMYLTV